MDLIECVMRSGDRLTKIIFDSMVKRFHGAWIYEIDCVFVERLPDLLIFGSNRKASVITSVQSNKM